MSNQYILVLISAHKFKERGTKSRSEVTVNNC